MPLPHAHEMIIFGDAQSLSRRRRWFLFSFRARRRRMLERYYGVDSGYVIMPASLYFADIRACYRLSFRRRGFFFLF